MLVGNVDKNVSLFVLQHGIRDVWVCLFKLCGILDDKGIMLSVTTVGIVGRASLDAVIMPLLFEGEA